MVAYAEARRFAQGFVVTIPHPIDLWHLSLNLADPTPLVNSAMRKKNVARLRRFWRVSLNRSLHFWSTPTIRSPSITTRWVI